MQKRICRLCHLFAAEFRCTPAEQNKMNKSAVTVLFILLKLEIFSIIIDSAGQKKEKRVYHD